jgi:SRSO17 transposase
VARQYTGTAGRIENSQVGVFLAYVTPQGHSLVDRELYLPEHWAEDSSRRLQAGIPEEVRFRTKPQQAQQMLQRAFAAGLKPSWVVGDEVYGRDGDLRRFLEQRHQSFVLAVASNTYVWSGFTQVKAGQVLAQVKPQDWTRLSAGAGSKGPRLYDWARVRVNSHTGTLSRWLLFRRSLTDADDVAHYLVHAPAHTPLETMVRAAGSRWPVEECFESAKGEVGLDEYEVRSYTGWYRHMTLCLVAHAFLAAARVLANTQEVALLPKALGLPRRSSRMSRFLRRQGLASSASRSRNSGACC